MKKKQNNRKKACKACSAVGTTLIVAVIVLCALLVHNIPMPDGVLYCLIQTDGQLIQTLPFFHRVPLTVYQSTKHQIYALPAPLHQTGNRLINTPKYRIRTLVSSTLPPDNLLLVPALYDLTLHRSAGSDFRVFPSCS
ncbi:hypothetical protein IMSAGC018_00676 [Lachnospiraceae bacterium]|nr:hypothetical protein IMSAGC018_00676 [Lachnospiraceae bacterium]